MCAQWQVANIFSRKKECAVPASTSPHKMMHLLPSSWTVYIEVSQFSGIFLRDIYSIFFSLYYLLIIMGIMHNLFVPLTQ